MASRLIPRVGCIVLAAGAGRRFGGDKLIAPLRGKPLLQYAVDAASGSRALHCTLVVGAHGARVLDAVDPRRCSISVNVHWPEGIASSIRCGLRARADDDACVMLTGDQPFVTSADIDRLIDVWENALASAPIVALRARDAWGAPVLFSRRDFAKIRSLDGDAGAKRYAAQQSQRLIFVDAGDSNAFTDVDTSDDLRRLNEL